MNADLSKKVKTLEELKEVLLKIELANKFEYPKSINRANDKWSSYL